MFSYFKELLATLRELRDALNNVDGRISKAEAHLARLNECINDPGRGKPSLTVRSWKE